MLIPEHELEWTFARSGGPGGQNVNKVSSKAQLRWNLTSSSLPEPLKQKLLNALAQQLTRNGDLLLVSQRFRDQGRNIADCRQKLALLLRRALTVPRQRRPTQPTRGARERRLAAKKHQSARKRQRRATETE